MIKTADWIIDLGFGTAGVMKSQRRVRGGELIAEGSPEHVVNEPRSFMARICAVARQLNATGVISD